LMAHSATLDWRGRSLVENCFASVRISSRYFASTTLSYSRNVSSDRSRPSSTDRLARPARRCLFADVMKLAREKRDGRPYVPGQSERHFSGAIYVYHDARRLQRYQENLGFHVRG